MEEFLKEHGFEYNSNDENLMEAKWEDGLGIDTLLVQAALEGE